MLSLLDDARAVAAHTGRKGVASNRLALLAMYERMWKKARLLLGAKSALNKLVKPTDIRIGDRYHSSPRAPSLPVVVHDLRTGEPPIAASHPEVTLRVTVV